MPDTTRRLIARALWPRQGSIAHDRTDLGRGSNLCVPVHEVSPRSSPARSQRQERSPARLRRGLRSKVSYRLQASVVRTSEATPGFWRADPEYSLIHAGYLLSYRLQVTRACAIWIARFAFESDIVIAGQRCRLGTDGSKDMRACGVAPNFGTKHSVGNRTLQSQCVDRNKLSQ